LPGNEAPGPYGLRQTSLARSYAPTDKQLYIRRRKKRRRAKMHITFRLQMVDDDDDQRGNSRWEGGG
jgi:hypothetical protein